MIENESKSNSGQQPVAVATVSRPKSTNATHAYYTHTQIFYDPHLVVMLKSTVHYYMFLYF